jgi:hypothetical protein
MTLTIMSVGNLLDKAVDSSPTPKVRARKINLLTRNRGNFENMLLDIYSCHERAKHWKKLSPIERILLELRWTDLVLKLLSVGNTCVMRSIRYSLCEQESEEDKEMEQAV